MTTPPIEDFSNSLSSTGGAYQIPQRFLLVRVTGLEPARRGHQNLNLARLPIPPYPRVRLVYPFCGYLSILMMVLIGSGALAKQAESALTPRGRTRG